MLKKDWKKNLLRMKQMADQGLGRAEKSEVLSEDLVGLEKRVDLIRQVFHNTHKKLGLCIPGQGTDVEKRLKKIPESGLSHSMIESATLLGGDTLMGMMFQLCGDAEGSLAREWLQYEMEVENKVLTPVQQLLETDIPAINKLRKQLAKVTLDMDSARGRYHTAARQSHASSNLSSVNKADIIKDELEDASTRVEQCRDQLATEMYSFISKESDYSSALLELVEEQAKYHRNSLETLEKLLPQMKAQMEKCDQMPLFGCPLEDHLRRTNRDIASVLEDCVCTLLEIGMDEEGLFRIAGGASKVKKLKAAFNAGAVDMNDYIQDIHCISGALKLYLRELPEPLMTFALYNEWMQAAHLPADQRLQALWVVLDKLPKPNYNNLRYLIKFLAKLAEVQEVTKMTPGNISIVIGPNLIWPPGDGGPSVLSTSTQSAIVESFIVHADWFFPGEIDFNVTGGLPVSGTATPPANIGVSSLVVTDPLGGAGSPSSSSSSPVATLCAATVPTLATNSLHTTGAADSQSSLSPGPSPKINQRVPHPAPSPKINHKVRSKKPAPPPPVPRRTFETATKVDTVDSAISIKAADTPQTTSTPDLMNFNPNQCITASSSLYPELPSELHEAKNIPAKPDILASLLPPTGEETIKHDSFQSVDLSPKPMSPRPAQAPPPRPEVPPPPFPERSASLPKNAKPGVLPKPDVADTVERPLSSPSAFSLPPSDRQFNTQM